jgi:Capsule polysaccharide biosynthesis protein
MVKSRAEWFLSSVRERVKTNATPLRAAGWWCRAAGRILVDPPFRHREIGLWRAYRAWKREYGEALRPSLHTGSRMEPSVASQARPKALIVAKETINGAKIEIALIKGLELAGYVPVVLTDRSFVKFYKLAGVSEFIFWEDFTDRLDSAGAEETARGCQSIDDLLAFHHAGARVGRFAASTVLRFLRVGHLDLADPATRKALAQHLALGMLRARAAQRILQRVRPGLALFLGNRYTGQGELMDVCVAGGVSVVTWFEAHRGNLLMLKRYNRENTDQHHASLSEESWRLLRCMEWSPARRDELRREIDHNYATGDWYCRGGTQFDKRIVSAAEIRERLGLDPRKKTAVIFPHIIWDATLFWGRDLFENYEEWLIETVRAACANSQVNWVIKIHPAHVIKNIWEGYTGEPAEMVVIRGQIGQLPPHVFVIPASSDVNTFSLFDVMDYCVTVRGTIGIEAATLGIPVVTAGSGRFDRHGFTVDSETTEEYLDRLAHIQEIPKPTAEQRELAERFAYGAFVLRPLALTVMTIEYDRDQQATMRVRINAKSSEDLEKAPDLRAFADWVANSTSEDFLSPLAASPASGAA